MLKYNKVVKNRSWIIGIIIILLFAITISNHFQMSPSRIDIYILDEITKANINDMSKKTIYWNDKIDYIPLHKRESNRIANYDNLAPPLIISEFMNPSLYIEYDSNNKPDILQVQIVSNKEAFYWDYELKDKDDKSVAFLLPDEITEKPDMYNIQVNCLWRVDGNEKKNKLQGNKQYNFLIKS